MALEVVERVTERFFRGDAARPRGELGLGLAIAQNGSKGSLQINSQQKKRTVVTLFSTCCYLTTIG